MVGFATVSRVVFVQLRETTEADFVLDEQAHVLEGAEVFGVRNRQPEKMDVITRLPLKVNEQLQSISVVSDKLIADQGALTIADVSRNVPGTYTYATYGNTKESISSRGFRGIPVLKNGVRINSDFRGQGFITDMSGVESMQVMKGAAAVTQGVATDLGSPGGVVNIVTKTPKFVNSGLVRCAKRARQPTNRSHPL
jgi:iron complex outermembrane receptor protein